MKKIFYKCLWRYLIVQLIFQKIHGELNEWPVDINEASGLKKQDNTSDRRNSCAEEDLTKAENELDANNESFSSENDDDASIDTAQPKNEAEIGTTENGWSPEIEVKQTEDRQTNMNEEKTSDFGTIYPDELTETNELNEDNEASTVSVTEDLTFSDPSNDELTQIVVSTNIPIGSIISELRTVSPLTSEANIGFPEIARSPEIEINPIKDSQTSMDQQVTLLTSDLETNNLDKTTEGITIKQKTEANNVVVNEDRTFTVPSNNARKQYVESTDMPIGSTIDFSDVFASSSSPDSNNIHTTTSPLLIDKETTFSNPIENACFETTPPNEVDTTDFASTSNVVEATVNQILRDFEQVELPAITQMHEINEEYVTGVSQVADSSVQPPTTNLPETIVNELTEVPNTFGQQSISDMIFPTSSSQVESEVTTVVETTPSGLVGQASLVTERNSVKTNPSNELFDILSTLKLSSTIQQSITTTSMNPVNIKRTTQKPTKSSKGNRLKRPTTKKPIVYRPLQPVTQVDLGAPQIIRDNSKFNKG